MKIQETKIEWYSVTTPPKNGTRVLVLLSLGNIQSGVSAKGWCGGFKTNQTLKDGGSSIGGFIRGDPVLWAKYPRLTERPQFDPLFLGLGRPCYTLIRL